MSRLKGLCLVVSSILPKHTVRDVERLRLGPNAVPALLVRPETPGRHPAAILQHGYAAEKSALLPFARELAAYGFVVLLADAWGHGERFPVSGPNWMTELTSDYMVDVVRHTVDDVREGLSLLARRPEVRADRLLVGGFSLGAIVALLVGTEDARTAGVVSIAGSPLPDMLARQHPMVRPPSEDARRYIVAHDAAAHVARLAPKPLLISHGRHDDMVPAAGALRLHEQARPYYARRPGALGLRLYDHTHTVTSEQALEAVRWIAPFFLDGVDAAASGTGDLAS